MKNFVKNSKLFLSLILWVLFVWWMFAVTIPTWLSNPVQYLQRTIWTSNWTAWWTVDAWIWSGGVYIRPSSITPWNTYSGWVLWLNNSGMLVFTGMAWWIWSNWNTGATWTWFTSWYVDNGVLYLEFEWPAWTWTWTGHVRWATGATGPEGPAWADWIDWQQWMSWFSIVINIVESWSIAQCTNTGNIIEFYADIDYDLEYTTWVDEYIWHTVICQDWAQWPAWPQGATGATRTWWWSLTWNTVAWWQFIWSTNNSSLVFRANNIPRMRLTPWWDFYVTNTGTQNPSEQKTWIQWILDKWSLRAWVTNWTHRSEGNMWFTSMWFWYNVMATWDYSMALWQDSRALHHNSFMRSDGDNTNNSRSTILTWEVRFNTSRFSVWRRNWWAYDLYSNETFNTIVNYFDWISVFGFFWVFLTDFVWTNSLRTDWAVFRNVEVKWNGDYEITNTDHILAFFEITNNLTITMPDCNSWNWSLQSWREIIISNLSTNDSTISFTWDWADLLWPTPQSAWISNKYVCVPSDPDRYWLLF